MGVIADQSLSAMLRQSADDFLTGSHSPSRLRGWIGRARPVESSLWHDIAALGWTGLLLPEALGGSGLGLREATVLCEVMGERLFAEPFVGCCVMPSLLLTQADNGPATEQLAAWQVSGERLLALAWQEQAGQMDPDLIECRVDQGRLSGRKVFVLGAEQQSVLLVSALEHGQPVIVAVAANAPGVRVEAFAAGIGAQYHVDFDQAPVLFEQVLLRGSRRSMPCNSAWQVDVLPCRRNWRGRQRVACNRLWISSANGCSSNARWAPSRAFNIAALT